MWIVIRLILSLVVAISRIIYRLSPKQLPEAGNYQGMPYYVDTSHDKEGDMTAFELGMPLPTESLFKFGPEGKFGTLCKSLGISTEYQTGDSDFDQQIYLACDHPVLLQQLGNNTQSRQLILELLLQRQFQSIWSDGEVLWASKNSTEEPKEKDIQLMAQLVATLMPVCQAALQQKTPFLWRFLAVEAFVWALFGYAATVFLENRFNHHDYHLDSVALFQYGLVAAAVLMAVLMMTIILLLRKSSRGHTIVTESFVLLLLTLPLCGMQLVSDINRNFDSAKAQQHVSVISSVTKRTSSGRRSGLWTPRTTYQLELQNELWAFGTQVPQHIDISENIYQHANKGKQLLLSIKPGFLGLPWYEKMTVYPAHTKISP
jgi:hypothetical protein